MSSSDATSDLNSNDKDQPLMVRSGSIRQLHSRKLDQTHVLEQIYSAVKDGMSFEYSHHESDISPTIYTDLGITTQHWARSSSLNPVSQNYPENTIYARRMFNYLLATDSAFIEELSQQDITMNRFFTDVDIMTRCLFSEGLGIDYLRNGIRNQSARNAVERYADNFKRFYLRGRGTQFVVTSTIDAPPLDDKIKEHILQTEMAVRLAQNYVSGLTNAPFEMRFMLAEERSNLSLPFLTEHYSYFFEAGFDIAFSLIGQVLRILPHITLSEASLKEILEEEISRVAQLHVKRCVAQNLKGNRITFALGNDAKIAYLPSIIARLTELHTPLPKEEAEDDEEDVYNETKDQQQEQQNALSDEKQQKFAQLLGVSNVAEQLDSRASSEAVEAGQTIIDFFKNLKMDGKEQEQAIEQEQQSKPETGGGGDDETTGEEKNPEESNAMESEYFEVHIGNQPVRRMNASTILRELRRGKTATFAKQKDMVSFINTLTQQKISSQQRGFQMEQLRYLNRGRIVHYTQMHRRTESRVTREMHAEAATDRLVEIKEEKKDRQRSRRRSRDKESTAKDSEYGDMTDTNKIELEREKDKKGSGRGKSSKRER